MIPISLDLLVYIIAFFLFIHFLYTLSKEKDTKKKLKVLAKSIAELDRKTYESEMRINDKIKELRDLKEGMPSSEIDAMVAVGIEEHLLPVSSQLHQIDEQLAAFSQEFATRIVRLEGNLKDINISRSVKAGTDDQKILTMYKEGYDIEEIAKELRISKPEVEFSLKLANLK